MKHTNPIIYPRPAAAEPARPASRYTPGEQRLSSDQIAQIFGVSLAQARRIGAAHGGEPEIATDDRGRRINYYAAPGIYAYFARQRERYSTRPGSCPTGYCGREEALALSRLTPSELKIYADLRKIRTLAGLSVAKRHCIWYDAADCRAVGSGKRISIAPAPAKTSVTLPRYAGSLRELGPWIHAVGLFPRVPGATTLKKWKREGLIVSSRGAGGCIVYDVPATIKRLKNPYA